MCRMVFWVESRTKWPSFESDNFREVVAYNSFFPCLCLCRVYLTILTATPNVNTNTIASYLFIYNVFDAILAVFNVKLSTDRKKLELDASLVLILLLLWRESSNPYAERLVSPAAPTLPLLHTVASLLSPPNELSPTDINASPPSPNDAGGVLGYISSFFGIGSYFGDPNSNGNLGVLRSETLDVWWCSSSAGLLLLYFLFYLNPVVKSAQVGLSSPFTALNLVKKEPVFLHTCISCPIW